ncbi:MAG: PEP-CTERM sorting domain-containing protein, partial [Deltaproteobacteria bacterium]
PQANSWESVQLTYTAGDTPTATGEVVAVLKSFSTTDGYDQVNFDALSFVDPVLPNNIPEPATMLLLGTGLIGFAALGRKRFLKK